MFRVISCVVSARYRPLREEHVWTELLTLSRLRPTFFRFIAEEKSGWRTVMKRIFVGYGLSNWTGCWRAGIEVGLSRNCIFSKIVLFHAIINTWCIHFRRWKTWQVLRFFFIIEKSNWKMWLIQVFLFWFFIIKLIFFYCTIFVKNKLFHFVFKNIKSNWFSFEINFIETWLNENSWFLRIKSHLFEFYWFVIVY